jgi:drug/metabolite transporter (DMT)-like permease
MMSFLNTHGRFHRRFSVGGWKPVLLSQSYAIYTVAFVLGVYCNMRALESANVETVIIFRSCTPLAVAVCDYLFLGRELPSRRSTLALSTIGVGEFYWEALLRGGRWGAGHEHGG